MSVQLDTVPLGADEYQHEAPMQRHWSPYAMNGGTILAIAGDDFSIVASDTRLSEGFSIHTRDSPKAYQLTDTTVLACAGFHGDVLALTKYIEARLKMYEHEHNDAMSTSAIAAMLSTLLYYKRFFPYYVYNIIGGIDDKGVDFKENCLVSKMEYHHMAFSNTSRNLVAVKFTGNGKGCIYSFDPVGSYERETYRAGGSAGTILQPLLDNQIGYKNQTGIEKEPLSQEKAIRLVKDVFISATERDIYTGDSLLIKIITKDGVKTEEFALRKD